MLHMMDSLTKLQFGKLTQTVAASSFIDFQRISKKCISWRMLTKLQQGRRSRSRVGQSFAIELQDFISLLNGNPKLVERVKI